MSLCVRRLVFEHPFVNIECLALRLWIKGGVLLVKSSQVQISARKLRRPLQSLPETLFRVRVVAFLRFNDTQQVVESRVFRKPFRRILELPVRLPQIVRLDQLLNQQDLLISSALVVLSGRAKADLPRAEENGQSHSGDCQARAHNQPVFGPVFTAIFEFGEKIIRKCLNFYYETGPLCGSSSQSVSHESFFSAALPCRNFARRAGKSAAFVRKTARPRSRGAEIGRSCHCRKNLLRCSPARNQASSRLSQPRRHRAAARRAPESCYAIS